MDGTWAGGSADSGFSLASFKGVLSESVGAFKDIWSTVKGVPVGTVGTLGTPSLPPPAPSAAVTKTASIVLWVGIALLAIGVFLLIAKQIK